MSEEWKQSNIEPDLEISSYGKVRYKSNHLPKNPSISVRLNYRGKNHELHRLVADAFLPSPAQPMWVDHIDGNRINNALTNLRYVTSAQNAANRSKSHQSRSTMNSQCRHKGVFRHRGEQAYRMCIGGKIQWQHRDANLLGLHADLRSLNRNGLHARLNDVQVEMAPTTTKIEW